MFCDLVETESFTRAAERNFVSQSAVSQRIHELERRYGKPLVDRGQGRGRAIPTDAGRLLYEGAKQLLAEAEALEARVRGHIDEVAGTIRVATVYSVGLHAVPGRLKPFLSAQPAVNVRLEYSQTARIYEAVAAGAVDVGIVACPEARAGIEIVPFAEEEMVLICAPEHPLALHEAIRLRDLNNAAFISFADDIPTRRLIDEKLWNAGARVEVVSAYDNIETIKNVVEIGIGVALVPKDTVRQEAREGQLVAVRIAPEDSFTRPAGMLLKQGRTRRAAVRAFVEAMRQSLETGPH
jgi:LysR family transcriptional regulator, transcriptional activator of the cysJI operon